MASGPASRPTGATMAPDSPRNRLPTTTARLTTFGPGRNWQRPSWALNSSAAIQRFSSTSMRRAKGSTPPKPDRPTEEKAKKSARRSGRLCDSLLATVNVVSSSVFQSVGSRLGMRRQAFALGQRARNAAEGLRPGLRDFDQAGPLLEIVDAERRREAGATGGRQHVIRTGAVVTERFRGVVTDENGAGMVNLAHPRIGVGQRQFKVFRRDAVGDGHRLVHVADQDEGAAIGQRGFDDI